MEDSVDTTGSAPEKGATVFPAVLIDKVRFALGMARELRSNRTAFHDPKASGGGGSIIIDQVSLVLTDPK
jgi:hypothetical protein